LLVLLLAAGIVFLGTEARPAPSRDQGRYLVEAVAICFECHSERDFSKPGWPIPEGRAGGGRILWGEGSPDQAVAPNISPDKATGIGDWSDDEILRAVRDGLGRDGRQLDPDMPSRYFRAMSEVELRSVVLYLRSIPPVRHGLPYGKKYRPGPHPPAVAMEGLRLTASSPLIERGAHLVRLGGCETCHTPRNERGFLPGLEFAGGTLFRHGVAAAASSNLTPDPTGIACYDWPRFLLAIRTGRDRGRPLASAMPWYFYRGQSDDDLRAVFSYLQALPPVRHAVDNTAEPTECPRCGHLHGRGMENKPLTP